MNIYMMGVVYFLFELGEKTRFTAEAAEGAMRRYKLFRPLWHIYYFSIF